MNFKTTYLLFAALICLLIIFGLSQMFGTKPGEETYVMGDLRRANVTADNIDRVEIERSRPEAQKMAFVLDKEQKRWKLAEPYSARADSEAVNQLVRGVIGARREEKANVSADLKKFGLEPPEIIVTLHQGDDKQWKLNVGNESVGGPTQSVVYVTSSAQPSFPAAVKRSDLESVFKGVKDFRSKDLLADSSDFGASARTQELKLREAGHEAVVLDKGAEERWRFTKPAFGDADYEGDPAGASGDAKKITGVRDLLNTLDNLKVDANDDFVADNVTDFAKYGLEATKPDRLLVQVKRKAAAPAAGETPKEPETRVLLVGKKADDKGDKLYARLDGEANIVRIPAKSVDSVAQVVENPAALRNRDLVDVDQARTDAIDIKNESGLIKLRKPKALWELYESGKERTAEAQAVTGLLTALNTKRQVLSFPDPSKEAEMGFDKPEAVVSIWVDGLQKEEKKEEKPDEKKDKKPEPKDTEPKLKDPKPLVTLTFGKKEGAGVLVRRENAGGKTILAVPETLLAKVREGQLAYLERTLPSFSETAEVTGLTVEREGQAIEVEKEAQKDEKAPAVWKFKQPKELAGRKADAIEVDRVIAQLRGLHTDKLVADHPSAQALDGYGLKSPAIRATVKVQNKETKKTDDWVYLFGKETDDKTGRYGKENKNDLVFVVPPAVLETLNAELRDAAVFHFDADKVKAVKLVGWKQAVSFTFTLEAERKGKKWVVKAPPDFDLDAEQVETFVRSLADLRALRFLTAKGGPKPEYKLAPSERALQIEVTVEGEKAPLTLTLGALDTKEKGYCAQSSTLPGDVFLLPQERFEKLLSGPKALTKSPPPKQ